MKNRMVSISLAVVVALSVGLTGCGGEQVPEITEYELIISSTEGGSVTTPGEGGSAYEEGDVVNLVAEPQEGYRFVNWTGDIDTIADVEGATTTITMKDDYSIAAKFAVKQYVLITRSTEGGSVTAPGEDAYTYDKGDVVNLVAVADEGYQFINWTGGVSTIADVNVASTTITMNGVYSITANFAETIRDWYDLNAVRDNLDGIYVLINNLDSTTAGYMELAGPMANGGKGWEPIQSLLVDPLFVGIIDPVDPFTGSLDGQGYELRDLFIDRPDEDGVGLFGCVGGTGVIENLGMLNVALAGRLCVGGLAGGSVGTVSNSYSTGSVIATDQVGGLVGHNAWEGTVSNSYSTVSVTGGGNHCVGGLVGANGGTVSNSYSTGNTASKGNAGGLVGANWRTVSNSYSTGSVTGGGSLGGLVGWNEGTVSNSYSTASVTGEGSVHGLVGWNNGGTVTNSYYSYDDVLINGRNIITIGALFSEDFEQWLANDKFLDVNERLSQEDGYYLINDVDDFKSLLGFCQNSALKFRLTNDLDLHGEPNFYIPYLAGDFDGNGHKITNLSLSLDCVSQVGLFGYLASGGEVTGVGAENVNITGSGYVGGLVGHSDGTVSDSYATGRVASYWSVGGLVGWVEWGVGTVSNSYYNYDEVLINGQNIITIGALFSEDFEQWLANDKFLDVNERLSQEDGYYLINDVDDFKSLLAFGQDDSLKFKLRNDLDLGGAPNLYIPYLAGEFDGNGHKIRNLSLHIDFVAPVGLFGYLGACARVSEVGVENVNITGAHQIGGLAGRNSGTVSNSYSTGSVTGQGEIGGLVGGNEGTVEDSSSTGSVTGYDCVGGLVGTNAWEATVSNSYSTGSVTGGDHGVGGLVGDNRGIVSNSYSSGSVTGGDHGVGGLVGWNGGTVSNSYSSGSVTGDDYVGGLVGHSLGGTASDSFWDIEASGQGTSNGGTGKTTVEMQNIATFSGAGWSMVAIANSDTRNPAYIWNIVDGQTYPFLSWES